MDRLDEVEATFRDHPERVSIVATGRGALAWLIDLADTVGDGKPQARLRAGHRRQEGHRLLVRWSGS